jgi:hypothetical protein
MMHPKLRKAFEEIDADVFNGDGIAGELDIVRGYLARWAERLGVKAVPPRISTTRTRASLEISNQRLEAENARLRAALKAFVGEEEEHTERAKVAREALARGSNGPAVARVVAAEELAVVGVVEQDEKTG